ncbi:TPA: Asp-tRNA(Asn)/Glu-tRNA(Gln) amidotransferase subunit GatC [Candidatus Saccharibacteria bacterium]|nr:Asp-tRNA(Asn)/Glu-tRNA(Gln) amidotransferase subunit GatC [Candidatus Saccharibacteria bacterium]HIO87448.1 Asp-tRNA(Asn)/Glu-tRNA(Gln) amidotransferase subunit GatC [Candidatus Saccharibacteria bacterium]
MSQISNDDVRYVAALSKLDLTDEEVETYKTELSTILGYVDKLQEIDTDGVEPTAQVTGLVNVFRPDEVALEQTAQSELLKNVPAKDADGHIQVRRVL